MFTKKMTPIAIIFLLLLTVILQPQAQANSSDVLDRDQISIRVVIRDFYDIVMEDENLVLDLASEIRSKLKFFVRSNLHLTVAIDSVHGLGELNQYFEYVLREKEENEFKDHEFKPGGEFAQGIVEFGPGENEIYLLLRLTDELAEEWETVLEADLAEIDSIDLGDNWTKLTAGEYEDTLIITFARM